VTTTHNHPLRGTTLRSAVPALTEWWFCHRAGEPLFTESLNARSVVVRAHIPGIDPNRDIDVTVRGDVLRIVAVRARHIYSRSFHVPVGVQRADVQVDYSDGCLTVTVPAAQSTHGSQAAQSPDTWSIGDHR
jgi:HSP20 family protein